MKEEQQWAYTTTERAKMVASARAWKGTQAEFAAAYGIAQSTVSRWVGAVERREYTDAERLETVAALRAWKGTQTAFAISRSIPQTTLSRWANGDPRPCVTPTRGAGRDADDAGGGARRGHDGDADAGLAARSPAAG